MISLRLFSAILATLLCGELAHDQNTTGSFESGIAVVGLVLGFGLLSKFSALAIVRSELRDQLGLHQQRVFERFQRSRRIIETLWVVALPLTLLSSGWVQWTHGLEEQGQPHSLILLLLFMPSLCLIALIEMTAAQLESFAAEAHVEKSGRGMRSSADKPALGNEPGKAQSWCDLWLLRLRLGEFANVLMCLLPVFLIAVCNDSLQAWTDKLSDAQLAVASTGLAVFLVLLFLPNIIGKWMGVTRLENQSLLRRIEAFRVAAGIRRLDVAVVPSQGRWAGAAVVGWFPGFRKLWLGDALIDQLDSEELDMVILHEMAHVKRLHVVWRSLPILWTLGLVGVYWIGSELLPPDALPAYLGQVFCLLLASGTLLVGLGLVSRSCEMDADQEACRLATNVCEWARDGHEDSEKVMTQALRRLLGNSKEASRRTWLHPSLRERVSSIAKHRASKKSDS